MTATEKLKQAMDAARQGMANNISDLKNLAKEADRRHDQAVDAAKQSPRDDLEEARAGLAAAGNYCRSLIESATGETMADPDRHDSRDDTGKFAQTHSPGHLFRKMLGR